MNLWPDEPLYLLDTETTSADPTECSLVQVAVGVLADHCGMKNEIITMIVDPGCDVPDDAAAIHGITTERAQAEGVPQIEALSVTLAVLHACSAAGRPLVVMNARYDLTILKRLADEHDAPWPELTVIDPFVIDRHQDRYRSGRRTLTALCEHYGVRFDGDAHDATADAIAAGRLVLALADVYPPLRKKRPVDLHRAQVSWFEEWRDGFNAYLERKDPDADPVVGTWPL